MSGSQRAGGLSDTFQIVTDQIANLISTVAGMRELETMNIQTTVVVTSTREGENMETRGPQIIGLVD